MAGEIKVFIPMWLIIVVVVVLIFAGFSNAAFRVEVRQSFYDIKQNKLKDMSLSLNTEHLERIIDDIREMVRDIKFDTETELGIIKNNIDDIYPDLMGVQSEAINAKWQAALNYPELIAQSTIMKDMFYDLYSKLVWIEHYTMAIYDQTEEGKQAGIPDQCKETVLSIRSDINNKMKQHVEVYDRKRDSISEIVTEHLKSKKVEG